MGSPSLTGVAILAFAVYWAGLVLYRFFLHPLAKFPGPRLAAITSWYEAYFEIIQNGQYSNKISQLHDQYGVCALSCPMRSRVGWLTLSQGPLYASHPANYILETRASSRAFILQTCTSTKKDGTSASAARAACSRHLMPKSTSGAVQP